MRKKKYKKEFKGKEDNWAHLEGSEIKIDLLRVLGSSYNTADMLRPIRRLVQAVEDGKIDV